MKSFMTIAVWSAALVTVSFAQNPQPGQSTREQQPGSRPEATQGRTAEQQRPEQQPARRYYDNASRDYHEWNQDEDGRYREYSREKRLRNRTFDQLSPREQSAYWRWDHQHYPDRQNGTRNTVDEDRQRNEHQTR
jgi:hypothetical protein